MTPHKQVLIVEDNPLNRELLCEILSDSYRTLEAENGQEALNILARGSAEIAIILLDVMMPVMDGYAFLHHLKQNEEWSLIPVIVMTQGSSEADEIAALAHGATDFVPKPYSPQVILHRVASLIKLRETAAMVNQLQYDRLTGVYSREFFYRKVHERLEENPDRAYTIVCTNIENFKLYNDIYGARAGDELLRSTASCLQDYLGPAGVCGRYSADRFLFLQEREQEVLDRRRFFSNVSDVIDVHAPNVVMKWGVYPILDRSVPVEQMCDRALLAVDSIKGRYNRMVAIYDDAMRSRLLRDQQITAAMESSLAAGQFTVYLQPKYSLTSGRMSGAEALVRWIHPEWGFISPGDFIPLFEKNGFITQLDQFVWEQACALLHAWKAAGLSLVPVSVNVSRADVYQADLVGTLTGLVRKYGLSPAWLHLEITESVYTDSPAQLLSTVAALREEGFVIEMDDFGSGYSSLNMLTEMKLDVLKLDMKFVRNETAKPEQESILRYIMELAHWKRLNVVAEGVESGEQVERLRAAGCDYAQGYFFARPMPAAEFEPLLRAQAGLQEEPQGPAAQAASPLPPVLVVEEDADYRARIRRCLSDGYRVLEADSPASALALLRGCGGSLPHAIVLSMSLPRHGAQEVLSELRREPVCWQIPVLSTVPQCDVREDLPLTLDIDDFLCKCHPISDLRRRVDHLVQAVARRQREADLQDEASRDYATGLLNRRGLMLRGQSLRREDLPLSVFLFDLDNLKVVNDADGHATGDLMIKGFADLLRRKTRPGDILCRYGGDEFVAILPRMGSEEQAMRRGETICREYSELMAAKGVAATCSAGIALCGVKDSPAVSLIDRADSAMYRAKQQRKGSCCVWDPSLDDAPDGAQEGQTRLHGE